VKIIASLVLYKHVYKDVEKTLFALLNEESIDKVCIVDNGNHCDWVKDLAHPKIEFIPLAKNRGFGSGHNAVFNQYRKRCEYVLICNPDISFTRGQVDELYHYCQRRQCGLAIPKVVYPDGSLQHGCKLLPTPWQLFMRRFGASFSRGMNHSYELQQANYNTGFFAPSLSGCFMLISSEALNAIGGFDERYFLYMEDVDLSRRVCTTNLPVEYCPSSTVVHESQRRSYRDFTFLLYHITSAIKYFNKWGWLIDKEREALNSRCLSALPKK